MEPNKSNSEIIIECGNRVNEWTITIDENKHKIYFLINKKNREYRIFIDDEEVGIPSTYVTKYLWIDYPIEIDGNIIHCVYDGETFDFAFRGKYFNKQKDYLPLKNLMLSTITKILALIISFVAIGFEFPAFPIFVFVIGIMFIDSLYLMHLKKKSKEE